MGPVHIWVTPSFLTPSDALVDGCIGSDALVDGWAPSSSRCVLQGAAPGGSAVNPVCRLAGSLLPLLAASSK